MTMRLAISFTLGAMPYKMAYLPSLTACAAEVVPRILHVLAAALALHVA